MSLTGMSGPQPLQSATLRNWRYTTRSCHTVTVVSEVVNHRGAQPALGALNAWAESAVRLGSPHT
mgnify:CR=1 FL=1